MSCHSTSLLASRLLLLASLTVASAACGSASTDTPGPRDAQSPEVTPDGGIVLPTLCSDSATTQATAKVAAAIPCFAGNVTSAGCASPSQVCARFEVGAAGMYVFRPCNVDGQARLARIDEAANAALQGIAAPGCFLSAWVVDSQTPTLLNTIVACDGMFHAIVFDASGAIVDAHVDGVTDPKLLTCLQTAMPGATFSCLANIELCSVVPLPL